jgi:hypothetical protein
LQVSSTSRVSDQVVEGTARETSQPPIDPNNRHPQRRALIITDALTNQYGYTIP